MSRSHEPIDVLSRHARGYSHDLGRMDFKGLLSAFFTYPTVLLYLSLAALAAWAAMGTGVGRIPLRAGVAMVLTFFVYAAVWYVLHRWVLHGKLLYRFRFTARLWKRIHYDHHQEPTRMSVLFGAPVTTLPTIAVVTYPLGWMLGGMAGGFSAMFAGLMVTVLYEFCHCCMHLNYTPRQRWLQRAKTLHMAHHFHNESGNYGIISFWPDQLFGSLYEPATRKQRSQTVFNLGYDAATAADYPWVADLSGGVDAARPEGRRPS